MTCRYAPIPLLFSLAMCTPARGSTPDDAPRPVAQQDTARPTMKPVKDSAARAPVLKATEPAASAAAAAQPFTPDLEKLWKSRLSSRIKREPWKTTQRYEAASLLMVPLHAAFERGYAPGQLEFADHVTRFLAYRDSVDLEADAQLSWLQYFYLLSRFNVLAAARGDSGMVRRELASLQYHWVRQLWLEGPAWQWYRKPFPGGVRERLDWKLSGQPGLKKKSFERAILDQELMLFAIAADLRHYGRIVGSPLAEAPVLEEIGRYARRVYDSRAVWNADSGWTFQPGIWRDHPDHLYECREEKRPGLAPCTTVAGAEDASHGHRVPLLLRSLAEAEPAGSAERAYYERLQWGLERQFFTRIAVPPSGEFAGWRIRNYMDGRNGMYRWGYASLGPDQGFGPYELSGILISGWWAFLPGERTAALFRGLAAQFPLPEELAAAYSGPVRRKPGSPPGIMRDGTAELLARLAADLSRSQPSGP